MDRTGRQSDHARALRRRALGAYGHRLDSQDSHLLLPAVAC